jgi:MHS family proline/betaine transporter-like MFS transporter
MEAQTALTSEQKRSVAILSIGTFLEYFDLFLYVHMAVILNDLFFSKTDSFSSSLLSSFSFCATFVFRPVGALFIGWLGDSIGRKSTVILTSMVMSCSCIAMANLPTYDQVGITASIAVTLCRILQGMSSMGEVIGAEIYLTETISPPKVYSALGFILIALTLGGSAALAVANLSLAHTISWRSAFWIGAIVAVIGMFARKCLRETVDFADAKRHVLNMGKDFGASKEEMLNKPWVKQKLNPKTAISFFLLQLPAPVYFYFIYIHCSEVLKDKFNFDTQSIIQHNLHISITELIAIAFVTYIVSFVNPLKILKAKYYFALPVLLACPFLLDYITNSTQLMILQIFLILFVPIEFPASPIFYRAFPIFRRFTTACFSYALSRALMHVISSFGIIYLIKYFGNLGLLFVFAPVIFGYGFGLFHFIRLEGNIEK